MTWTRGYESLLPLISLLFLSPQGDYWGNHNWYRGDDQDSRAMLAYESMLRIALYQPNSTNYQHFTEVVKQRAFDQYNFSYEQDEQVCEVLLL